MSYFTGVVRTPLGAMKAEVAGGVLTQLTFIDAGAAASPPGRSSAEMAVPATASTGAVTPAGAAAAPSPDAVLLRVQEELDAYFAGELRRFTVPVAPAGTPFQQEVWRMLQEVPYGVTRSYGDQARLIGRPTATRAVARANGDNPIAIIIPCHRIVGASGRLTGYGGGLWRKQRLLDLESGSLF